MKLRALIVDDEAPARSELRYLLAAHPEVEVVGEAATAREALQLAAAVPYDAVFCDIEMPGLSGLEAARLIRGRPRRPALVFVTAHQRYAVEAFDYVLKPVDPERLARVVERLAAARSRLRPPVERIAVAAGGGTVLLEPDAVCYVRAEGDYSRVYTHDRSYLCTRSLRELEDALPAARFLRIHRSYLVNLARVAGARRAGAERLRLCLDDRDRTELDVARRQSRLVRERLRL